MLKINNIILLIPLVAVVACTDLTFYGETGSQPDAELWEKDMTVSLKTKQYTENTVELTLPAGFGAAASGMQTGADGNTLFYELKNARDFCIVLSDGFEKLTADAGGTPVNYYHCDDAHAEEVLDAAAACRDKFSRLVLACLNKLD